MTFERLGRYASAARRLFDRLAQGLDGFRRTGDAALGEAVLAREVVGEALEGHVARDDDRARVELSAEAVEFGPRLGNREAELRGLHVPRRSPLARPFALQELRIFGLAEVDHFE